LVRALEDKKAEDIVLLDLRGIAIFTDFFVICSGTSDRMLRSLLNTAKESMHDLFDLKGKIQGIPSNGWIVVDYGNFVLHLFSPEQRNFYLLEELWAEGKILLRIK
jgi:ribosome-associated protein